MISSEECIRECIKFSKDLENAANKLSIIYSTSIWLAVIIGILMIGNVIKNQLINFIVGGIGLLFTLVPLILKNKIQRIEGYRSLSIDFKNMKQDFSDDGCSKNNLARLKSLRRKLSKHPTKLSSIITG